MTTPRSRAGRAPWGDVRFYIGIALVLLSVIGVWLIVSTSRQTAPVLQADRTIIVGEAISSNDFVVVEASLGAAQEGYLAPQDLVPGLVATRTLSPGELVPSSGVGDADERRTTTVVVESTIGLPAELGAGSVVELWQAPATEEGFDEPRILVADATVAALVSRDGMLAQSSTAVELVIDRADVAEVLSAVTGGAALSIVPTGALP
ncbi:SAF domain-containing protein [Microbacterium sp. NPDC055903]